MNLTVEEGLSRIETKAAALRYLADLASGSSESADPKALSGLGDILGEIEEMARSVKKSLNVHALGEEIRKR